MKKDACESPWFVERVLDKVWAFFQAPWPATVSVFLVLAALITSNAKLDIDLFHRLAVGRLVQANGSVVHQDPFSFSPRLDTWIDHEWLSGVVFHWLATIGGDRALITFDLLLVFLTVALVVQAQRCRFEGEGSDRIGVPWLLITLPLLCVVWVSVIRCRAFTFLFLSILLLVLVRWRNGKSLGLWSIPPLFLLWVNLHGGVVAGLGIFGLAAVAASVEDLRRSVPLWICLTVSGALTLVNPYGWDLWAYLGHAAVMDRPGIMEWRSISPLSMGGIALLVFATFVIIGGLFGKRSLPLDTWLLFGGALVATFWSQRIVTFLLLISAIFPAPAIRGLGLRIKEWIPGFWVAGRRVGTLLFLALIGFSAQRSASRFYRIWTSGVDSGNLPVEAVEWLQQEGNGGKLLVSFSHGSFALWRLYPEYLVSVDSRYEEVYPQATVDLSHQAISPTHPSHAEALATLDPDYILVQRRGPEDSFSREWKVVFESELSRVLARNHVPLPTPRSARGIWEPGF